MAVSIEGIDYQIKLVALMVVRKKFLLDHRDSIQVDWFESLELQVLVEAILKYFDKYRKPPTYKELNFWIKSYVAKDAAQAKDYKELIIGVRKSGKSGMPFVADHFQEFITYKAYRQAILAGVKALEDGQYDVIPKLIRKAERHVVGSYKSLEYSQGILERLKTGVVRDVVSTGISELDDVLGGGPARTELTIVLAPTSRGKTMFLVNLGWAALDKGLYVAHFFVEQTEQIVASKYDCRFLNMSVKEIKKLPKSSTYKLQQRINSGSKLSIIDCGGWTMAAIRSFIYRQGPRVPDVVIIDYPDKLVSARQYGNFRHEILNIYGELISLGKEFNCAVLVASQTSKGALTKKDVNLEDVDEEFGKCKIADNVIAMCQTTQEFDAHDMRLATVKVRNEESRKTVNCKIFPYHQKLVSRASFLSSKLP